MDTEVSARRVILLPKARSHLREALSWRREHDHRPELLLGELKVFVALLRQNPELGKKRPHRRIRNLRRVLMPESAMHLYYAVDLDVLRVYALWHAHRRRGTGASVTG